MGAPNHIRLAIKQRVLVAMYLYQKVTIALEYPR